MATIADISQVLGDYMLKGWVLTDQSCPTPGCAVPLVRSPKGRTPIATFCVKCSGGEPPATQLPNATIASSSNVSSDSHNSRSSTPPTEFSEAPSSPVFVPPIETEETRRRREQSDQASSEIGKRLLKGWAMLGDECPNDTCYGVPLVRPPRAGGEKDPRKECVVCGNTYVTEIDWAEREALVPYATKSNHTSDSTDQVQAGSSRIQQLSSPKPTPPENNQPFSSSLGLQVDNKLHPHPSAPRIESIQQSAPYSAQVALDETSRALQTSLQMLSGRLASLSSHATFDPSSVGVTADAIGKVTQALAQVRQLQWNENQANDMV